MKIHLHLGAHKTATTSIQNIFEKNRNLLHENSIFVPNLQKFRQETHQFNGTKINSFEKYSFEKKLDEVKYFLISDENLLGDLKPLVQDGIFYPFCEQKLKRLSIWLPSSPGKIFLSIRSYEEYFPSAISEILKEDQNLILREKTIIRLLKIKYGWTDLLQKIQKVFPHSQIIIWKYEDIKSVLPTILNKMLFDLNIQYKIPLNTMHNKSNKFTIDRFMVDPIIKKIKSRGSDNSYKLRNIIWDKSQKNILRNNYSTEILDLVSTFNNQKMEFIR